MTVLAVRPIEAAKMIGITLSYMYKLIGEGKIPTAKIGRCTVILVKDLEKLLEEKARCKTTHGRKILSYVPEQAQKSASDVGSTRRGKRQTSTLSTHP